MTFPFVPEMRVAEYSESPSFPSNHEKGNARLMEVGCVRTLRFCARLSSSVLMAILDQRKKRLRRCLHPDLIGLFNSCRGLFASCLRRARVLREGCTCSREFLYYARLSERLPRIQKGEMFFIRAIMCFVRANRLLLFAS